MSTALLASLEKAIQDWVDSHCEDDDWPTVLIRPELMALAAKAVFDAAISASEYTVSEMG